MARSSISSSDPVSSYMDGVNVKIAEAYKPPRKVTLPAAYNNKFPDITRYNYDFSVERSILNKLEEWRKARKENKEAREQRIEERKKREQEKEELTKSNSPSSPEVLPLPVKVAPAPKTTILTPQPLSPPCDLQDIDLNVKSNGLDYADFDNDTSSPFDNMELKTINDMEELAQVLQPTSQWVPPARIENILKELTLETKLNESNHHNDTDTINKLEDKNDNNNFESKRRNISIIVEELERELERSHMENWKPWPDLESPDLSNTNNKELVSQESTAITNVLSSLSSDEDRKLAKHLSDMGFPLSRAARAISDLGGKDNKKVVEYLLAVQCLEDMGLPGDDAEKALALNEYDQERAKKYHDNLSTLKDLGFSEDEASKALLNCDNDRDKALDYLCA
ncbi:ubiquitin-associated protein 1 [Cotesia glomerata]|uniref:Ubiquitin-associated protein 1 n=1 Tax=Cotesia glomerata TaxID=32391 RepID=A0AAV7J326_COTGL|nr:ubiquitin-associated protein 1 [Cotesia glomerata]XP_044584354.1 ubiquitin-associated protein 1 [Cotesia glomerata]KAH0561806.1 hypothetical protein KQX54_019618 [Cotesia glomerata]